MSTLIKEITEFKEHITVSHSFKLETILPYIKKQERKHIKSVLGRTLYNSWVANAPTDEIQKEVFVLFQEASSNLAMVAYASVAVIDISEAGFLVATGQDVQVPTWYQLLDQKKMWLKTGFEAIDEALKIMEENEADFQSWVASEGYTYFKELFTRQTATFERYYSINKSRLTFLQLRPHLLKVETKFFNSLLGEETVFQIKHGIQPEEKKALKLCQAAQVPLCVASVAHEGVFELTSQGLFTVTDDIPGKKKTAADILELDRLHLAKSTEGNEQLKLLLDYLRANPQKFIQFALKEKNSTINPVVNTGSIVSF